MIMPNKEQSFSIIRAVLVAIGSILGTLGYVSEGTWQVIMGLGLAIAPLIWGIFVHTQANAVAVAAAVPEVSKIEVNPTPQGRALMKAAGSAPEALVVFAPPS